MDENFIGWDDLTFFEQTRNFDQRTESKRERSYNIESFYTKSRGTLFLNIEISSKRNEIKIENENESDSYTPPTKMTTCWQYTKYLIKKLNGVWIVLFESGWWWWWWCWWWYDGKWIKNKQSSFELIKGTKEYDER